MFPSFFPFKPTAGFLKTTHVKLIKVTFLVFQGLAVETCGGGLYEELSVYAQAEGAEAPWE